MMVYSPEPKSIMRLLLILSLLNSYVHAVTICAHRGARGLFPENTLGAFEQSMRMKISCIDMDVVLSQDKVPMVYHDFFLNPDFTRQHNRKWVQSNRILLKNLKYWQIQQYRLGTHRAHTQYAKDFSHQQNLKSEPIPSLKQALTTILKHATSPIDFQIELKTEPHNPQSPSCHDLSHAVAKLIYQFHLQKHCKLQSFDWACLKQLHRHYPELTLAYLTEAKPTTPPPYHHLSEIPKKIHDLQGQYWDAEDRQLNRKCIANAHRHGLKVCAWSYAEPKIERLQQRYKKLIHDGIDCIITDYPNLL